MLTEEFFFMIDKRGSWKAIPSWYMWRRPQSREEHLEQTLAKTEFKQREEREHNSDQEVQRSWLSNLEQKGVQITKISTLNKWGRHQLRH